MDLTLFHAPDSRSSRLVWLLEEIGAPYTLAYVDIARRSGAGAPDPSNPHPDKRVPALLADGGLVSEGAAIALALCEFFPAAGLGPPPGVSDRGAFLTWLAFYAGEVEPAYAAAASGQMNGEPFLQRAWRRVVDRVALALDAGPYLLGTSFSAADLLVSGPFEWLPAFGAGRPAIAAWLERLLARPALRRARELDSPPEGVRRLERPGR